MKATRVALPMMILALSVSVGTARAEPAAEPDNAKQTELDQVADERREEAKDDPYEVVCEWVAETGSRIKQKRCRTRARIERDAEQAERFVRKQRPVPTSSN